MKLTPAILKNIYSMLYCCEPFSKWKLPLPEQIKFVVDSDPDVMGTYLYDDGEKWEHIITITTAYRDWETDRKSTRLNSSHSRASRMPSSA